MVAHDKLAQFETADEIAQFFIGEGIRAEKCNALGCVISKWLHEMTGDTSIITNSRSIGRYLTSGDGFEFLSVVAFHTPAMAEFVTRFDRGNYAELETGEI